MNAAEKQKRPVGVCTNCRAYSYHLSDRRCYRKPDGKKQCKGVFGSAIGVRDWEECEDCNAIGKVSGVNCRGCGGVGWHYVRVEW